MSEHASLRARVYWWLERPDREARGPRLLEIALILLITANVTAVILETVSTIYAVWQPAFDVFERISLTMFIIEYAARLWVVPENPQNRSRRAWVVTPSAIIDLLAILPALLVLLFPVDLRILRAFRIVRLLKLTRYSPALGMLLAVFEEEAGAFFAGFFILIVMLVLAASGAWLVEHQVQPDAFGSIPAAMWWAVATLTTVGYGDVTPVTIAGKIFGAIITVLGIGMAALPAGILASGLNDQLHRRRSSMQAEFRRALEDGFICDAEEVEIEDLRKSLGLSYRAALQIRSEVEAEVQARLHLCPSCGRSLSDQKETSA
ncbi:voltage-gated potassium channel [Cognatiyoonia sediminum]|uniref:Voltage-gated potassium channel n=1 Tax=Cognatiyoonia sediminum TaxID=1508389 RepID=A0A1M5NM57_9RHOB|nr:ion transporter [Cognatiyoonia sediminum]SHG90525.1 voltage-gated potassium channel [Cognatiyoonia sediminum]